MNIPFIGRDQELALLNSYSSRSSASLIVIHGRRRIGKSRLIDEFGKGRRYFSFTGMPPGKGMTAQKQRTEFARKLVNYFNVPELKATNWADLFTVLADQCQKRQTIVLLDEISWMGMKDPTFLGKLKNAWDQEFKKNKQLMLILCGSVSTWIEKNILSSTGFVGRINHVLILRELLLKDCSKFWNNFKTIAPYEKFKLLSVTGGIPLYLEAMDPKLSAEENIRRLCFVPGGLLVREFNNIFTDLFSKRADLYIKIIRTLLNGPLDSLSVAENIGKPQSGWLTQHLNDLEQSQFIRRDHIWNFKTAEDAKLSRYRLSDNYIRFYLKYIEKNLRKIERHDFQFKSMSSLPGWEILLGYQFENLVLNNRNFIQGKLHLKPDEIIADNPFFQKKTAKHAGCQIDYLIQTKFNNLYICEIKFSRGKIGVGIIKEIQKKIEDLVIPKGFSCRPVLLHVNGVTEELVEQDYFSNIISFEEIIESS